MIGHIHSTESFGAADGPGVRFIVFMQGCHMRCRYCHNPDTWKMDGGDEVTADEILKRALRFKPYWGKDGGITISGGEPLLQIDFVIELFKKLKSLVLILVLILPVILSPRKNPSSASLKNL